VITALLGPTNTGKTHRAIERMLEHPTGMIGLPLRLLAREVYDKISARIGETRVALVTGEERRIPARPSYWVCTVEAMPVQRDVDFVAIDEVQLAAHDQRGHVFTSRLLGARGKEETWFLGSDTVRGVLRELVPTARHVEHPRLSRLTHAGATPLSRLPPRSAVVAFSMPHVYEIADRIRARKGGAAVVLGALSPRTRNAQVAMFQAGEVDWLVATDAIGMGLNLDVEHVAFAALRKFDGKDVRDVEDAELGQIAGRAGRWIQDGTFGTLTPLEIPSGVVHAVETHAFPRITRVRWRNDDLDFSSVRALVASLNEGSKRKVFRHVRDADDHQALVRLADREDVARLAAGEERVRLLWDVCTVPDFRKLLFEAHVDFLAELYVELVKHGRARDEWIEPRIRVLEDKNGDVETLVARIAATRIWTFVANRDGWTESELGWRERTRALEDDLSDALHERLVLRFVDEKKTKSTMRSRPRTAAPSSTRLVEDSPSTDSKHPFAALAAMRARLAPPSSSVALPAASWTDEVIDAEHAAFRLDVDGRIVHVASSRAVGQVVRGASINRPDVRLLDIDDLGAGAKSRVQRRMLAYARDVVGDLMGGVQELSSSAHVRGLVHRLEQGLGTARESDVADVIALLTDEERVAFELAGLRFGAGVVYLPRGLTNAAIAARVALASIAFGARLRPPSGGAVSFVVPRGVDAHALTAIGFPVFGPRAVRADVIDRVLARVRAAETPLEDTEIASWLGAPTKDVKKILSGSSRVLREPEP
jgi:ATP-dependent RNA helicase SUPV3L1/SUV3